MQILPDNITNLIDEFSKLPSIGAKSAERMVFYLLANGDSEQFGEFVHFKDNFGPIINFMNKKNLQRLLPADRREFESKYI